MLAHKGIINKTCGINAKTTKLTLLLAASLCLLAVTKLAAAVTITEYSAGIMAGAAPYGITAGPDGNIWFTERYGNRIGKITPSGVVTEYSTGISAGTYLPSSYPTFITVGPDGNLWFTEYYGNRIGKITPSGVVTEYSAGITASASPYSITAGLDGNIWFTEWNGNRIGKITPSGMVTEYPVSANPYGIAPGPDGNLWFTDNYGDAIGKITPGGVVSEYSTGKSSFSEDIALGPDGNLWFTDPYYSRISKITPSGVITEYSGIPGSIYLMSSTAGPDGNLWFTGSDYIGKIMPNGVVTQYSTGITPGAGPAGITVGADGNLWFTEYYGNRIGKVSLLNYTVGGNLASLGAGNSLVLQNNGGDNLTLTANGSIAFGAQVATGSPYNVSVLTQPIGQTCTVNNGSGTMGEAKVTNVSISCTGAGNPVNAPLSPWALLILFVGVGIIGKRVSSRQV